MTIVTEVERAMGHHAPFTPKTYVPRVHFFVLFGCESYKPRQAAYDAKVVLHDQSHHLATEGPLVCI